MNLQRKKFSVGLILLLVILSGIFGWVLLSNTNGSPSRITTKNNLQFGISKTVYTHGETVIFWIKNIGNKKITLGSTAPWEIDEKTSDGWKVAFSPVAAAMLVPVKPGEKITWHWDQTNGENEWVGPGAYRVVFFTQKENTVTLPFTIRKK